MDSIYYAISTGFNVKLFIHLTQFSCENWWEESTTLQLTVSKFFQYMTLLKKKNF